MSTKPQQIKKTETLTADMELPEGWAETALDVVGKWTTGGTPSRKVGSYFGGRIAWVKSGDLNDGQITETEEAISRAGLQNSAAKVLPPGTVSIALYGATIGKLGIFKIEAATNQACASCQVDEALSGNKFVFYYLLHQRQALIAAGQGGAQPNLTNQIVREWPVLLPPLAEQERIVNKTEQLLAELDSAKTRLSKLPFLLKHFRQAVLAAACSGKLTEDWRAKNPDVEPIPAIIGRIRSEREAVSSSAAQRERLRQIYENMEEHGLGELPATWAFVSLNKLCASFDYGTSAKSQTSGRVPVLRMGNIQEGSIDWTDLAYTSNPEEIRKYRLQSNTVLFNRTNSPELVGKTAIYRGERLAIFAGYLIRIVNFPELDPEYLNLCLNTNYAREFCSYVKTDGVSQSNINAQKLGTFAVPYCPLKEQYEIIRRVESLFKLMDAIEKRVAAASLRAERLTQAVLAKAFRGELVLTEAELARREGREYEAASVLLERIKAEERQSEPMARRTKKTKAVAAP